MAIIDPIRSPLLPRWSNLELTLNASFPNININGTFSTCFNLLGCIHLRSNLKSRNGSICLKCSYYLERKGVFNVILTNEQHPKEVLLNFPIWLALNNIG